MHVEALIAQLVQVSIFRERKVSCATVSGAIIIYQKAGLVIDKERRRARYRGGDNTRPKLFDSEVQALCKFAELHEQSTGVLIFASDQVTVIGVT